MKYKSIFNYIVKRADVRELENILIALQAISVLSPAGVDIINAVISKSFDEKRSAKQAREVLTKAKFELASHIYF